MGKKKKGVRVLFIVNTIPCWEREANFTLR